MTAQFGGLFSLGVDSNNYRDTAKVWGVRDTTGVTDSDLRPFSGMMMVRRLPEFTSVATSFASICNRIGGLSETVVVSGGSEIVQTQTAAVATTLDVNQISKLPVGRRSGLDFVVNLPGVNDTLISRKTRVTRVVTLGFTECEGQRKRPSKMLSLCHILH